MRIIGGKYNRRVIRPPKNLPVRPTTDLAKESLFNILEHKTEIEDAHVLDLFSGTGALSYEFVSRGCAVAVAIEINHQCVRFIKETAADFGMEQLRVIRADVFRFLRSAREKYDIIVADPPYDMEDIRAIRQAVFEKELLNPGGWLVIEHPAGIDFSTHEHFVEHRRYGHVNFSFFSRESV